MRIRAARTRLGSPARKRYKASRSVHRPVAKKDRWSSTDSHRASCWLYDRHPRTPL